LDGENKMFKMNRGMTRGLSSKLTTQPKQKASDKVKNEVKRATEDAFSKLASGKRMAKGGTPAKKYAYGGMTKKANKK
jgi:hypothetical protein